MHKSLNCVWSTRFMKIILFFKEGTPIQKLTPKFYFIINFYYKKEDVRIKLDLKNLKIGKVTNVFREWDPLFKCACIHLCLPDCPSNSLCKVTLMCIQKAYKGTGLKVHYILILLHLQI